MHYREHHPKAPLNRYVECFWILESETLPDSPTTERILPDGCVELILNFGARFLRHTETKQSLQPLNFLVGQMTGPVFISPTGTVRLLGLRFHPGGTVPFFSVPIQELTDQIVELGSLASRFESELMAVGSDLKSMDERIAAIETLLISYVLRIKTEPSAILLARKIVDCGGIVSVDQLANETGISARQLERRFLSEVGIGPKLLSRIVRFQQVFRAVEKCDGAWAPVAVECGYYDQAHLIRDFNQFAQQTPAVLFAEQSELTHAFTRKDRTSDFSNTAIERFS